MRRQAAPLQREGLAWQHRPRLSARGRRPAEARSRWRGAAASQRRRWAAALRRESLAGQHWPRRSARWQRPAEARLR
eukprot:12106700-Heterocapsa_arctica.AAC.1